LFSDKKCVHIKLNADTHVSLKALLFKKKISIQELFEEFAQQLISEKAFGRKFVDSLYDKKVEAFLNGRKRINSPAKLISNIDVDIIYDAINFSINENKED
jgi:hypothetical protein